MTTSTRRTGNLCSECQGPLSLGNCINPRCKNCHMTNEKDRPTRAPPPNDIDIDVDADGTLQAPLAPSSISRHDLPTKNLPPEQRALRDWLEIPQAERPPWPDKDACADETCGRHLEQDFLFCPLCGLKRELPRRIKETAEAYKAALKPQSMRVHPTRAIPPPPPGGKLHVPPSSASSPRIPARRVDPRSEESHDPRAEPSILEERLDGFDLTPPTRPRR